MSHNLVTEIKKSLSCSKIVTGITFPIELTSKVTICLSIPPVTLKLSTSLCPNLICVLSSALETIWCGKCLWFKQASFSYLVPNWALCRVNDTINVYLYVTSLNQATYDRILVKMSVAAFAIFPVKYPNTLLALQMLSERAQLLLFLLADYQQLASSIRLSHMLNFFDRNSWLCTLTPAVSIRQASSTSVYNSASAGVLI